jgi:hypothetical protein
LGGENSVSAGAEGARTHPEQKKTL